MIIRSIFIRAVRSFLQSFLAVLLAAPALDLSTPVIKAAAVAGLASVLAMAHRLLDETAIPSLPDTPATPVASIALAAPTRSDLPA
jgi:hypothetical protein